jgi:hypothetical protein
MPTGSISLSGITDEQLVKAIQIKEKSNNKLIFPKWEVRHKFSWGASRYLVQQRNYEFH